MVSEVEEIFSIITEHFVKDRLSRALGQWSTVIQFTLNEEKPFYLVVDEGSFEIQEGLYPKPKTTVSGDTTALKEVLKGVADITHFIAGGKLRLVRGDYFDLLNLSRAAYVVKR